MAQANPVSITSLICEKRALGTFLNSFQCPAAQRDETIDSWLERKFERFLGFDEAMLDASLQTPLEAIGLLQYALEDYSKYHGDRSSVHYRLFEKSLRALASYV